MTNKKILLFFLIFAFMVAMVSCTVGNSDDSEPYGKTSDVTEKQDALPEALELLNQAERLSKDYESFVQTTQTTSSTDDGNVISSLRSVMKKSGESYSFSQLTEAFNERGNLTADSLIEMMYDGVGIPIMTIPSNLSIAHLVRSPSSRRQRRSIFRYFSARTAVCSVSETPNISRAEA